MRKWSFLGLLPWIIIWEVISHFYIKDPGLFPSFFEVLKNLVQLVFVNQKMGPHLAASSFRFLVAFAIAAPLAYFLAVLAAGQKVIRFLFNPIVTSTYPLPKVALIPLVLLFFGTGDLSKIVLIGLGVFYLIYINTYHGAVFLMQSPMQDVINVYHVKGRHFWYSFLTKGSFKSFLVGAKAGAGYGLTLVVVSEMSLSQSGVGYFIWSAWDSFRILDMYSGIFLIGVLGFIMNYFSDWLIDKAGTNE
ncbi:MAG: hypothetical protein ABL930_05685 [Pseudobdellovibrio sp.]